MNPLVISGPSGTGKSYLVELLSASGNFQRVVPITTRTPRASELNGEMYHFIDTQGYLEIEASGQFFMSNEFLGARYGMPINFVTDIIERGKVPVSEIYVSLVNQFLSKFPNSETVFLMPMSIDLVRDRMLRRGDDPEKINARLESAEQEIDYFNRVGHNFYKRVYEIKGDQQASEILSELIKLGEPSDELKYYFK